MTAHQRRLVSVSAAICFVVVLVSAPFNAGAACTEPSPWAHLSITTNASQICVVPLDLNIVTIISIGVEASLPMKKVSFSLPALPPSVLVLTESPLYVASGDLENGIEFDLGGCVENPGVLMTLVVLASSQFDCTPWLFGPGPSGSIEVVDCDDQVRTGAGLYHEVHAGFEGFSCVCGFVERCTGLPPTNLFPADGATEVPLDVVMSWPAQPYTTFMNIGTNPDCTGQQFIGLGSQTSYAPDFLQPGTTYYWTLGASDGICGVNSGVYSFTTEGSVATESVTWGAIKATYQ